MDNHPIPQDVTNFQFRFVGNMTLKQFGYIAAGVILAWVFLAAPLPFLIRILLAGICVLAGVILSFIPIEGRPADQMVMHFIHALFNPNQFTYKKTVAQNIPQTTITTTPSPITQPVAPKKEDKLVKVETLSQVAQAAVAKKTDEKVAEVPSPKPMNEPPKQEAPSQQEAVLSQEVNTLTQELAKAKEQETQQAQGSAGAVVAHEKVLDLEKELQTISAQKQELEKQLIQLQKALTERKQQVFTPTTAQAPAEETQSVKRIPKQMTKSVGTPLVPDVPNLVTGIIKDSRGNVLPNMLIEVKDKDGNPVRAFKTNQLGQFASATPLVNGTYTISFEDPAGKHSFDSVELQAAGEVIMPLEIISVDAREKLRQELFGPNMTAAAAATS